jgi:hypothetical protein
VLRFAAAQSRCPRRFSLFNVVLEQELLDLGYYHLVFSVPHELAPLMWQNKRQLFSLLFEASAATLLDVAAAPSPFS